MTQMSLLGVPQQERTSDDYYTPAWVFERMGIEFDLDVCSPPDGIPWIPATRYFTKEDDGLAQDWHGRVWMNPPYSAPGPWVDKFIAHGNGVCLVPASNGGWLWDLWQGADAFALPFRTALPWSNGQSVPIRVMLAAFGDECVEAIGRLGRVR